MTCAAGCHLGAYRLAVGGAEPVGTLDGVGGLVGLGAKREQVICRFRRGAGGADDGPIILAQDLEPGADIVGVAHGRHDAERGGAECSGRVDGGATMGV